MAITHSATVQNALCAYVTAQVDLGSANPNGRVVFFDVNNAAVATIQLNNPAFGAPIGGIAQPNSVTADSAPTAGSVPVRFEVQDRDGHWIFRGSCGPAGDLGDSGLAIVAGVPVNLTNFFYRAAP